MLISEVGPRDGLQAIARTMPTPHKHAWIASPAGAGLREIEVCSFVPPKLLPQMADAAEVVAQAAGGSLADVVKLNLFLTDLAHFAKVNEIMALYFSEPYPARAAVGVASLPRSAGFEAEAVMVLPAG